MTQVLSGVASSVKAGGDPDLDGRPVRVKPSAHATDTAVFSAAPSAHAAANVLRIDVGRAVIGVYSACQVAIASG